MSCEATLQLQNIFKIYAGHHEDTQMSFFCVFYKNKNELFRTVEYERHPRMPFGGGKAICPSFICCARSGGAAELAKTTHLTPAGTHARTREGCEVPTHGWWTASAIKLARLLEQGAVWCTVSQFLT